MQTTFHPVNVYIVTEARFGADARNPGLRLVQFPRVEIEHGWELIYPVYPVNHPVGKAVGHQPKIATTTGWPVPVQEA